MILSPKPSLIGDFPLPHLMTGGRTILPFSTTLRCRHKIGSTPELMCWEPVAPNRITQAWRVGNVFLVGWFDLHFSRFHNFIQLRSFHTLNVFDSFMSGCCFPCLAQYRSWLDRSYLRGAPLWRSLDRLFQAELLRGAPGSTSRFPQIMICREIWWFSCIYIVLM